MVIVVFAVANTIAADALFVGGEIVLVMAVVSRWMWLCGIGIASHASVALEIATMLMSWAFFS